MNSSASHTLIGPPAAREVSLLDLLDRLLEKGVVLRGDVTLSVVGVDLILLDLAVLLASVERATQLLMPDLPRAESHGLVRAAGAGEAGAG